MPDHLSIRHVKLSSLHLDPANARTHGTENLEAIVGSLKRFGQAEPLVVQKATGRVIGGNGRMLAMEKLGWKDCDIVEVDVDDLTATALGIALNRTGELAEWNEDSLAKILYELKQKDALEGLGYGEKDVEDLFRQYGLGEGGSAEDPGPGPPPEIPASRTGDLWIMGDHRLLCGDSTKAEDVARLMAGKKAQCLCWDPPFNIGQKYDGEYKGQDSKTPQEYADFLHACLNNWETHSSVEHVVFVWQGMPNIRHWPEWFLGYEWRLISVAKGFVQARPTWLQWSTDPVLAWTTRSCSKPVNCKDFFYNGQSANTAETPDRLISSAHPCPRSAEVCSYFIGNWTERGELVCDMSLGSGTTLIAAEQLGRRCFGLEIEPRYCDVILRRWEKATGKEAVLEATGQTFAQISREREAKAAEEPSPATPT